MNTQTSMLLVFFAAVIVILFADTLWSNRPTRTLVDKLGQAKKERTDWRQKHINEPDYFQNPVYQCLWDQEIGIEADLLLRGFLKEEASFEEYRKEKKDRATAGYPYSG